MMDTRRTIISLLVFSLLLLTACTSNLPPSPGVPGSATPIGKATGAFEGYAEPTSLQVTPTELILSFADLEGSVDVSVSGEQYVYKTGYVLDIPTNSWNAFTFDEPTIPLTNWVKGDASKTLTINKDDLGITTDANLIIYVIAYACTKSGTEWSCHENKWMITNFTASVESAPPEPTAPGQLVVQGSQSGYASCDDLYSELADNIEAEGIDIDCIESSLDQPLSEVKSNIELDSLADNMYVEDEGDNKNNIAYSQNIKLGQYNPKVVFGESDSIEGNYLLIDKGVELYKYALSFASSVAYSTTAADDDLIHTTLTILERVYSITDVTTNDGTLDSMTLMTGQSMLWLTQDNPITKYVSEIEHTIEVLDVKETITGTPVYGYDACQVKVNAVTGIIDVADSRTIDGVEVKVISATETTCVLEFSDSLQQTLDQNVPVVKNIDGVDYTIEVLAVSSYIVNQDEVSFDYSCQVKVDDVIAVIDIGDTKIVNGVNMGILDARIIFSENMDEDTCFIVVDAQELLLANGRRVRINDVEIDGTSVNIPLSPGTWSGFTIAYDVSDLDSDVYFTGDDFQDPVFGLGIFHMGKATASDKFISGVYYRSPSESIP